MINFLFKPEILGHIYSSINLQTICDMYNRKDLNYGGFKERSRKSKR